MKVPFAIPECGNEEIEEVAAVIRSGWLTTASRCAQFEKDFAGFVGARHALVVSSTTAALHLGLEALGVKAGDKVLVPTFTFTATAEVVRYLRADPVFVDCDRETFCINTTHMDKAIEAERGKSKIKGDYSGSLWGACLSDRSNIGVCGGGRLKGDGRCRSCDSNTI